MYKALLFSCLLLLTGFTPKLHAQQYEVYGTLSDTLNLGKMQYASVVLMHLQDSSLSAFTRSDSAGSFRLQADTAGKYLVRISYPGFADFVDNITVKKDEPHNMGIVAMVSRTQLMNEFIYRQRQGTIRINGDTTEYTADSFKVHDNATVEDLLKKMPGLQIDKDGGITAQGVQVQKVLVDGEEFFSDDPAVVTKSLDAKAVDKVQVFDKKSDEAVFTGIDDGQKIKTINLQLKEDRRKGFFGKVQAGGGTDGYFENQGMINAFKGKRQISAFGIVANTGKMGLGWEDKDKYSGSSGGNFDEESGNTYYYSSQEDGENMDWSGKYNGEGLPTAWTGGAHYANKWDEAKEQLSGNYRYGKQNIDATGNTLTQYSLPGDSQYYQRQDRSSFSSGERHKVDGQFEWKPDTTSSLKVTVIGGLTHTITNTYSNTDTRGLIADGLINNSDRVLNTDASNQKLNSTLMYRKKLKKKGRNYSINLSENYSEGTGDSYLLAHNNFYKNGILDSTQTTDQYKSSNTRNFSLNGNLNYTEPLSKVAFLTVGYGLGINNNTSTRLSYNREQGEFTDLPDSTFSSKYDFNTINHKGIANLKFVYKKYNFSLGATTYYTVFNQNDLLRDTSVHRTFTNYAPAASLNYNFSKQKRISLNYSGNTRQPTIEQLQPLRQNTDPLNQQIGNPDLKQQFTNNLNLNFNDYKVLTGQWYYVGAGGTITDNAISSAQTVNEVGGRTTQYINVDGNYNGWLYANTGKKLTKLDMRIGLNLNANFNHSNNYVNGLKNTSNNNNYGAGFDINKDWEKGDKTIASLNISPSIDYYDNRATISDYSTSYWSADISMSGFVELPWKLRLNTEVSINLRQKTELFKDNNNVVRWDAYCARKFGKGNKAEVRLAVYDILNQNLGFTRNASTNYVTQNSYNTIRRYGLLSFVWNFSKKPAGEKADDENN